MHFCSWQHPLMRLAPKSFYPRRSTSHYEKFATKPQTVADDDPDACTSTPTTHPASAAQRSYADGSYILLAQPRQTDRSSRSTAPAPSPGRAHHSPPAPSPSANSCASVRPQQTPSPSPSAQGFAQSTPVADAGLPSPFQDPQCNAPQSAPHSSFPTAARYPASGALPVPSPHPPSTLQTDFSCSKSYYQEMDFHSERYDESLHLQALPLSPVLCLSSVLGSVSVGVFIFRVFDPKIACQVPKPHNPLKQKEIELAY
jgi:hypothetical protein